MPRAAGRPLDEGKRAAIVAAARDCFFEHGYSATSIEQIARRAGVSKVTVYNRFADKQALFVESVLLECSDMQDRLCMSINQPVDLRDHLVRFGDAMLAFLWRPKLVRFENMLGGEMERHPELGELFLEAGPRNMHRSLSAVIALAAERGELAVDNPAAAAEQLGGMFKGFADLERRFGKQGEESPENAARRVRYAVDVFLRAHAPALPDHTAD
jgi:TetR/AcrR family transcriptional repressor of mexJK operon